MMIEFDVANYRSFKETITLSMVAANLTSKDKSIDENNVISVDDKLSLLATTVIYGANASGKSNLISAIRFMRNFVLNSSKDTQSSEKISIEKFRLSTETDDKPSYFQIVFLLDGKKYRYGFEVNVDRVISEWLFFVPRSREAKLFERSSDKITVSDSFREGKGIEDRTRDNALFLSVVAQFNGDIAKNILAWFSQLSINLGINDATEHSLASLRFDQARDKENILNFIKSLDLDIEDIQSEKEPVQIPFGPSLGALSEEFSALMKSIEGVEIQRIKTLHRKYDADGNIISHEIFDMNEHESQGTKRLFSLAPPILNALKRGRILFIDELDARLHPILTCHIINLFNNKQTNPHSAQLIFTTHDTNLLNNKILRRDQIWFAEKDRHGATHLYSLVEFKVRNDASFERDYVHGKYGAVPFIGDVQFILDTVK